MTEERISPGPGHLTTYVRFVFFVTRHLTDDPVMVVLPRLALLDAPPEVVARPLRRPEVVRRIHTCRLDTGHLSAAVSRLQTCLEQSLA